MLPHLQGRASIAYVDTKYRRWRLPPARAYFFSHFSLAMEADRRGLVPADATKLVFYTHPRETGVERDELVRVLSRCTQVLSMASMHARQLLEWGVPADRVTTVLGAADPELFRDHTRSGTGAVGLVSAYYARKQPDRILDVIRQLDGQPVLLLGRDWDKHPRFGELARMPHFQHVVAPYQQYPRWYAQMDVFLSLSSLEGGPIPLIEAMMSNVVPVATRTGFAPDVIEHGRNGFLCSVDATPDEVVALVAAARASDVHVRSGVAHLHWQRYAAFLLEHLDQT
jgi:glycosyltransferase involved in cell wall biosynthesis